MHRLLHVLLFALLTAPCWSAEPSVGESLTIPVPVGVRIRAKNPHEMHESHELTWYSKTRGTARGLLFEDTKQADASQLRGKLEGMMTREKEHNATLKIPAGTYSSIETAPLKRGPWKEALWYTYEGALYPPAKGGQETIETQPPLYTLKMVLWDGKKMWVSSFSSRDKANLAKWLEILEGAELRVKVARSGKEN